MREMLSRVKAVFKAYPILSNSAVYGTMCVTAELSQQIITRKLSGKNPPEPLDKASLVRFAIVGSCINSNILYFWYKWLDKNFVGTAGKTVLKKLLLDQFVLTPQLLTVFYLSMSIMEGRSDLFAEMKQKMLPTFQTSCCFWLPAQTINFLFVPPMARVVYVGVSSFAWVNILCYLKRSKTVGLSQTETQTVITTA